MPAIICLRALVGYWPVPCPWSTVWRYPLTEGVGTRPPALGLEWYTASGVGKRDQSGTLCVWGESIRYTVCVWEWVHVCYELGRLIPNKQIPQQFLCYSSCFSKGELRRLYIGYNQGLAKRPYASLVSWPYATNTTKKTCQEDKTTCAWYGMRYSHAQPPTMCGWWVIPWGHKHSCELTQRIRYHGAHSGLHTTALSTETQ